ncbi:MAG: hypothetical protein WD029_02870 [Microthrixaceae bacterium]
MSVIGNLVAATMKRSALRGQQISEQLRAGWLIAYTDGDLKL